MRPFWPARTAAWLLALVPIGLALVSLLLIRGGLLPNVTIVMQAELVFVVLVMGLGLSGLGLSGLAGWSWQARRRRQALERLRDQAAADRHRFLRRLDHELKNPLTAIRAGVANLGAGLSGQTERQTFSSVSAQVVRLSQLVADLRKLADLETRPLERAPVDLAALLQEAVGLVGEQPATADRQVALVLPQAPWPLPRIMGDHDLLFLVVHNLLDNAIKFSRPGDTIEVRAVEDDAHVLIEVADTGPGIAGDELPFVWDELYRGQGGLSVAGSGLGLALVRAVVTRHQGTVGVRSRVGQGTVVGVRLPLQ